MNEHVPEYDIAALYEAMAQDVNAAELGIEVRTRGDLVYLEGAVATAERRSAVEELARRMLPRATIHNDLTVDGQGVPNEAEEIQ